MTGSISRRAVFGGALAALVVPALPAAATTLSPLRVGVLVDDRNERLGAMYRAAALNAAAGHGHEPMVQLMIRDTGGDPGQAERALAGLLDEGVHALIAAPDKVIRDAANASCTPLITPSIDDGPPLPYVFHAGPGAGKVMRALATIAQKAGHTKAGVLIQDTLSTPDTQKLIAEAFAARGIAIGEPKTTVEELIAQGPQVLVFHVSPPFDGIAVRDARAVGWTGPILLTPEAVNPGMPDTAGPAAEGVQAVAPWLAAPDQAPAELPHRSMLSRFAEGFTAAHGPVSTQAARGVDAMSLLNLAFLGHRDRRAAREALDRMCCMGVTGVYNMTATDHSGLGDDALTPMTFANGAWTA